jgi:hypothetical protein
VALVLMARPSLAQEVGQADVRMLSLDVRTSIVQDHAFDITAVVYSDNDDDAVATALYVFLPPNTPIQPWPKGCHDSVPTGAYVMCGAGRLSPFHSKTFKLTVPAPPSFVMPWYTGLAFSHTADPDFANNVRYRVFADGTLARESSDPKVYVVFGGAKFWVPDPDTLFRLYGGWDHVHVVADGTLAPVGGTPSTGTLLKEETASDLWRIENGKRRNITVAELIAYGGWALLGIVPDGSLAGIPIA